MKKVSIHSGPMTSLIDDDFVVFLIGMRINQPWKIWKWFPVFVSMPRMLKELSLNRNLGLKSYELWMGRTILVLQYWDSHEKLMSYAHDKESEHVPAWKAFNKKVANNDCVGIWHETYLVQSGHSECMYVHMPAFGLGKAGELISASGKLRTARGRIESRK